MLLTVFLILLPENKAHGIGLGIVLGGPTGISLKNHAGGRTAIDGAIALSKKLTLQAQYIIHHSRLVYYGIGGRIKLDLAQEEKNFTKYTLLAAQGDGEDEGGLGLGDVYARAPIGARVFVERSIELFGEGALLMKLSPSTSFSIEVAIGARVYL